MKVIESVTRLTARVDLLEDKLSDGSYAYSVRIVPIVSKSFPDVSRCQPIILESNSLADAQTLFMALFNKVSHICGE